MLEFAPNLNKKINNFIAPILVFLHRGLGLLPVHLSIFAAIFGFLAIFMVGINKWQLGVIAIIISQIFDLLDGHLARKYGLVTLKGKFLDLTIDRLIEFGLIGTFICMKRVEINLGIATATVIILITFLKEKSKIDPGFKKFGMFLGYIIGFNLAFSLIFSVHLLAAIFSLALLDYKYQKSIDGL